MNKVKKSIRIYITEEFLKQIDDTIHFLREKYWQPINRTEFIIQAIEEKLERKDFKKHGYSMEYDVEKNVFEWFKPFEKVTRKEKQS
jgi:hypothetical protein